MYFFELKYSCAAFKSSSAEESDELFFSNEVEIKGKNSSAERILAPDYSSIVPPAQKNVNQEKISSSEISNQKNEISEASSKIPEENSIDKKDYEKENPSTQTFSEISSGGTSGISSVSSIGSMTSCFSRKTGSGSLS